MNNICSEKVNDFLSLFRTREVEERKRIRDEFLRKSGLSYPAWYSKMTRKSFSPLELDVLGKICGKDFL